MKQCFCIFPSLDIPSFIITLIKGYVLSQTTKMEASSLWTNRLGEGLNPMTQCLYLLSKYQRYLSFADYTREIMVESQSTG